MTTVINLFKSKCDIYIGRPSIFGNPFIIGKDGNREEVIQKYKKYFKRRLMSDENFYHAIGQLKDKKLGCFCNPLSCHGDIIVKYLEEGII